MNKIFLSVSLLFLAHTSFAAAPSVTKYPFIKKIQSLRLGNNTVIKVPLDQEALNIIKEDYSNFQLTNDKNEDIQFILLDKQAEQVKTFDNLEFSSSKEDTPSNIIDGNELTSYAFDERVDGKGDSWVLLDLGKDYPVHQLTIKPTEKAKIRYIEIKAGETKNDLKTIVSKKNFQEEINLTANNYRFFKISLWGISVKVQDIKFWTNRTADIYFEAKPSENYQIFYGNNELNSKRYSKRNEGNPKAELTTKLGKVKVNPLAPDDMDEDGVLNSEDNCVTTSNKDQKDRDNDRIGDVCDNAIENKNYDQSDIDKDGLGDIIDNCKRTKNSDQKDKDNDGKGDACDFQETEKKPNNIAKPKNNDDIEISGGLIGGILGIIAVGILGFFIRKKLK